MLVTGQTSACPANGNQRELEHCEPLEGQVFSARASAWP